MDSLFASSNMKTNLNALALKIWLVDRSLELAGAIGLFIGLHNHVLIMSQEV
jgi:hypothetical protein